MKNKVLLNVLLPATQRTYEFRVPLDLSIEEGTRLMSRILATRDQVRYAATDDVDLMLLSGEGEGAILNPCETFKFYVSQGQLMDGSPAALV